MAGNATISGVISGFDTEGIIAQMTQLQRAPSIRLQAKQTSLKKRIETWDSIKSQLASLQRAAQAVGNAATFQRAQATSSDLSLLTVSASTDASPGTYSVKVLATAQAHEVKSQGFADTASTALGTGTLSIQVGADPTAAVTINVDSTNNTLAGLRDAINRAGAGVTASILNDGDANTPYRLVLTSNKTGTDNQITLNTSLNGGTAPAFTTLQDARNASIQLGAGAGALTISKSTNSITDVIQGVTLNLQSYDPAEPTVNVVVSRDTGGAQKAVEDFVSSYNAFTNLIHDQTKFDPNTNTGGQLLGDFTLQDISANLESLIGSPVRGVSGQMNLLSQAGITMQSDGTLSLDSSVLANALSNNPSDVMKLFSTVGESTDPGVHYITGTDSTRPSDATGYAVDVTRVATQARVTAGALQTNSLTRDETLTINGTSVYLTAGMSQADVIAAINAKTNTTGITARATGADGTGSGNYLTLTRSQYGSAYTITAVSSVSNGGGVPATNTSGLGTSTVTDTSAAGEAGTGTGSAGVDVAGTINGEAATGSGQMLTGVSTNTSTAGLTLQVTAGSTGSHGRVTFTRGIASQFATAIRGFTDGSNSTIEKQKKALQDQIDAVTADMKTADERIQTLQDRLREQFARMESAMAQLQGQGTQLSQQIAALSVNKK